MNAPAVVAAIALLAFIVLYRRKGAEQPRSVYDAAQLGDAIRALAELCTELDNADRMLADLAACNPRSLLRGFRAEWCGIDGKRRKIDLLADGVNNTTAGLTAAAQEERERINSEIIETIRALQAAIDSGDAPAILLDVVGETVDETTAATTAGEW